MPAEPWTRAARDLRSTWPSVLDGRPEAVHRARVASRRLREALPVLESGRGATRLRKDLRRLARLLGPVREMDVCLDLTGRIAVEAPHTLEAIPLVRESLAARRAEAHAALLRRADDVDVAGVLARVRAVGRKADGAAAAVSRELVAGRIAGRAAALRGAIEGAGALYAPEPLHAVRIAAKKARYAAELARTAGVARAGRIAAGLRQVQDILGEWRDWHTLGAHAADVQSRMDPGDERLEPMTALTAAIEDRCRAGHAAWLARRARLAALVAELESLMAVPDAVERR